MHYEQIVQLALYERKLVNAFACKKITSVVGKSLWPAADMKITCKNYQYKPVQVASAKQQRLSRFQRATAKPKNAIIFSQEKVASLNDKYVEMINAMSLKRDRALLIGEARR